MCNTPDNSLVQNRVALQDLFSGFDNIVDVGLLNQVSSKSLRELQQQIKVDVACFLVQSIVLYFRYKLVMTNWNLSHVKSLLL